jgi:hypothetical protein
MVHFYKSMILDLRALAVMRILIGFNLFIDLCVRFSDLKAHYTDQGILPISLARKMFASDFMAPELKNNPYLFSLHFISGDYAFQLFLFLIMFIASLLLIVGYKTKWITPLVWLLVLSLHNRNILGFYPGDYLLRMVLLFGIFLPWGRYYSFDWIKSREDKAYIFGGSIAFCFLIFVALFFIMAGLSKTGESWGDGTAIHYMLIRHRLKTGYGDFLIHYPLLLSALSYFTLWFEKLAPLFIFIGWKNGLIRTFTLVSLGLMLASFGFFLNIHLLPFIGISMCVGALPSLLFDFAETKIKPWIPSLSSFHFMSYNKQSHQGHCIGPQRRSGSILRHKLFMGIFACFFALVLWSEWNRFTKFDNKFEAVTMPLYLDVVAEVLRVKNPWRMFPDTKKILDGYASIEAISDSGLSYDAIKRSSYSTQLPNNFTAAQGGFRWRRSLRLLVLTPWGREQDEFHYYLSKYFCQDLSEKTGEKISRLKIYAITIDSYAPGESEPSAQRNLVSDISCSESLTLPK